MPPKEKKSAKADDKKPEKPVGWNFDPAEAAILLLIFISLATTLVPSIWRFATSGEISFFGVKLSSIFHFLKAHIFFLKTFAYMVAGIAAVGTFVFTKKGDAIWRVEKARLYPTKVETSEATNIPERNQTAEKWQEIVAKSEAAEESNWRLAIIEADIILDSLLEKLNLPGQGIGEKLKAVEPSDFLTLDQAWEAHKARNAIAHQGGDFLLNQREVRRIISLYEEVFKEFHLI